MRWVATILVVILGAGVARGDEDLDDRLSRLQAARLSGLTLAVIGSVASVAALALAGTDPHLAEGISDQARYLPGERAHNQATYSVSILAAICVAVGVPLWAASSGLEKRARRAARPTVRVSPAGLTGRF